MRLRADGGAKILIFARAISASGSETEHLATIEPAGSTRWLPTARIRRDDPWPDDRRAAFRQRQDDGDAWPPARVQAPRRRRRRPQVRPRLHRSGLPRRGVGAGGRQSRLLGDAAEAPVRARCAGGGRERACAVRSLDGAVRRRARGKRPQRRLGRCRGGARHADPAGSRCLRAGAVGGGDRQGLRGL